MYLRKVKIEFIKSGAHPTVQLTQLLAKFGSGSGSSSNVKAECFNVEFDLAGTYTTLLSSLLSPYTDRYILTAVVRHQLLILLMTSMMNTSFEGQ
jgi:hypothetical protein